MNKLLTILGLLIALCAPAHAQKTPAAIQAEIASSTAASLLGGTILNDITNAFMPLMLCTPSNPVPGVGICSQVGSPTLFTDTANMWSSSAIRFGTNLTTANTNQAAVAIQANTPSSTGSTVPFQKDNLAVYQENNDPIDPTINLGSGYVNFDPRGIVAITNPYGNAWAMAPTPGIVYQPVAGAAAAPSTNYCRITLGTSISLTPTTGLNGNTVVAHDIGGVTGCTGTFVASVVSSTVLDLVGTTFGGLYTSGGAVSGEGYINGSEIDVYQGGVNVSSPNGSVLGVISSVVNNGSGNCRINVGSSTFTAANGWANGMWASVGGIQGATGCNGSFQITLNSATQVDLQNSVFGGSYTSGGGITGARPKFAYQAAAFGFNNSTAAFIIFGGGSTRFYHGLVAQQNALVTDFINLYATNGVAGTSLFNVDTSGNLTTAGAVNTTSAYQLSGTTALQAASIVWSPTLLFGGANTGMTFSNPPTGLYTRIGPYVHATFNFILSAVGSSTGAATLTGLPFAARAGATGICGIWYINLQPPTSSAIMGVISGSASTIQFFIPGNASQTAATNANFTSTTQMYAACDYLAG